MNEPIKLTQPSAATQAFTEEQKTTLAGIQMKLFELGLSAKPLGEISVGPLISVYRFRPEGKTTVAQLESLSEDMSMIFGKEVMIKRMPGETSVSFAIPNNERTPVNWLDTAKHVWSYYNKHPDSIPLGFGVNYLGRPYIDDLTQMPHLLIAGSTNGGKSTLIKSLIASIVYTMNSSTVNLVLSDTKGVEFVGFTGLPHLLFPTATSVLATLEQMDFLIEETERRLKLYPRVGATNIKEWNSVVGEADRLALIVMFIDECADIMDMKKIADDKLAKIARKSRAAGIHMVASTQRPDAKMIEGAIKANFPCRLSFRLTTSIDSRVALGEGGAERLMTKGDMLYKSPAGLFRLHSPKAELSEIRGAVEAAMHR